MNFDLSSLIAPKITVDAYQKMLFPLKDKSKFIDLTYVYNYARALCHRIFVSYTLKQWVTDKLLVDILKDYTLQIKTTDTEAKAITAALLPKIDYLENKQTKPALQQIRLHNALHSNQTNTLEELLQRDKVEPSENLFVMAIEYTQFESASLILEALGKKMDDFLPRTDELFSNEQNKTLFQQFQIYDAIRNNKSAEVWKMIAIENYPLTEQLFKYALDQDRLDLAKRLIPLTKENNFGTLLLEKAIEKARVDIISELLQKIDPEPYKQKLENLFFGLLSTGEYTQGKEVFTSAKLVPKEGFFTNPLFAVLWIRYALAAEKEKQLQFPGLYFFRENDNQKWFEIFMNTFEQIGYIPGTTELFRLCKISAHNLLKEQNLDTKSDHLPITLASKANCKWVLAAAAARKDFFYTNETSALVECLNSSLDWKDKITNISWLIGLGANPKDEKFWKILKTFEFSQIVEVTCHVIKQDAYNAYWKDFGKIATQKADEYLVNAFTDFQKYFENDDYYQEIMKCALETLQIKKS